MNLNSLISNHLIYRYIKVTEDKSKSIFLRTNIVFLYLLLSILQFLKKVVNGITQYLSVAIKEEK